MRKRRAALGVGGAAMTAGPAELSALLAAALPKDWPMALAAAEDLAQRLRYLSWPDRARVLDDYLWAQARERLSTDGVTAVVNRHAEAFRPGHPSRGYAVWCQSIVSAVLVLLEEAGPVLCAPQALTCLLSLRPEHRALVDPWLAETTPEELHRELARLPGYAFLLLTLCPNDSAESFMARDAFWRAMLG
ncbi:MAG: hypothetical protein N2038_03370 [Geminicoccaceae bacterium]|nr:hypothetical protein [Geminicoccaceae bacterium]MCX7629270.1 hypothetical protein [Geminicoccaceae bacterium]MDW8340420.1 hypothetical protein [Geminicoccaceae bacterium]